MADIIKSSDLIDCLRRRNKTTSTIPATDILVSILMYLIPFLNGLKHGTYLFHKYHLLELVFHPVIPLLNFYKSFPNVGLFVFFTLYLGIVRDRNFSRFFRFNSLQVMIMDFMSVVPELIRKVLVSADTMEEIGFKSGLLKISHDVTFMLTVVAFVYAFCKCVLGRIPEFPGVTHAVE
ncbi:protein TIC 20-II, chloroplastic-like [Papaver somniferum]|uniref:protein TIC 20-II, chloroplastic-like n=1 Tax=Papaver somniferum TaxID=3469 RepID=UPI000E6FB4A4|nr:protein TIC 20-II, chloroplastic-like [Papaver somniferum]